MTDRPQRMEIHRWFGLTYANYLVLPRSLLQSMPDDWQDQFVGLLEQLDAAYPEGGPHEYRVHAIDEKGRYASDPVPHYNRGRTYVPPQISPV